MVNSNSMRKNLCLFGVNNLTLLVLILFLVSCSKYDDDAAQTLDLKIGHSKSKVIDNLIRNPFVTQIRPDVTKFIEVRNDTKNKDEAIRLLAEQPGVVIERQLPRVFIKISFVDSFVSNIYLVPVNQGQDLGIDVGMNRESISNLLIEKFSNKKIDSAYNFMPRNDLIEIEKMNEKEKSWLFKNDTWVFGETNKYSHARLYFEKDSLVSIGYDWTPIELP